MTKEFAGVYNVSCVFVSRLGAVVIVRKDKNGNVSKSRSLL